MRKIVSLLIALILQFGWVASAVGEDAAENYAAFQLVGTHTAKDTSLGGLFYAERKLGSDTAAVLQLYSTSGYSSALAGLSRQVGNFQLALMTGAGHYDGRDHVIVSPWAFYSHNGLVGLAYAEWYAAEKKDPWWVKGDLHKRVSEHVSLGAYGETGYGVGPQVRAFIKGVGNIMVSATTKGNVKFIFTVEF